MTNKNTFIFDMDGVIIDSEPLWRHAQIKELHKHGISITQEDCTRLTMGKRIDDIAKIWCEHFNMPISSENLKESILKSLLESIIQKGMAKDGLLNLLDYLSHKNYLIALATSSSYPVINAVIDHLSIRNYFNCICSADDEAFGKPHPAVYLKVAKKLNVQYKDCIVLEDSVTGMISAKSAQMTTLVIPEDCNDQKFSLSDGIFPTMNDVLIYLSKNNTK